MNPDDGIVGEYQPPQANEEIIQWESPMRFQSIILALVLWATGSATSVAQVQARFVVDGLVNCSQPSVRNYPLHVEGAGTLMPDRTASLAVRGNVENADYNVKLGRKKAAVEQGSASLRVTGRHSLRATREYPNNTMLIDLKVIGDRCAIKVRHRLKPGKRTYTFTTSLGLAYCEKPEITSASCTPR